MADAYRPSWLDAPSLNDRQREGVQGPILKGKSRLEAKVEAKPLVKVTDAQFRKLVRERDKQRCRRCGRKTVVTLENVPLRCEVHHVHGRLGVLRHEDRCALCLCQFCHQLVTGRVNERWVITGTKFVTIDGQERIDARAKVKFERVA